MNLTPANEDEVENHVDGVTTALVAATFTLLAINWMTVPTEFNALHGFQSVELWWNYSDCREMRIAVGEDQNDLHATYDDPFTTETETGAETSAFCGNVRRSEP